MDKNCVIEATNELYRLTLLFPKKEPLRFKMRELADEVLASFVTHFNFGLEPVKLGVVENSYNLFEVLDSFFEVAKEQNWVKPSDILSLQQEYKNIKQALPSPACKCGHDLEEQFSFAPAVEAKMGEAIEEQALPNLIEQDLEWQKEEEEIVETEPDPIQLTQGISNVPLPEPIVMPESSAMEESNVEISERQKIILDILKQKEGIQVWEIKDILPDISKRTLRRDFKKLLNGGLIERKGDKNTTFYQLKGGRTE